MHSERRTARVRARRPRRALIQQLEGRWLFSAEYTLMPLTTPMGNVKVNAISDDGSVVVGGLVPTSGFPKPFRWTAATGFTTIDSTGGNTLGGMAGDVSGDGKTVLGAFTSIVGGAAYVTPFLWNADDGFVQLGTRPSSSTVVRAISGDGNVTVGTAVAPNPQQALRSSGGGSFQALGSLVSGGDSVATNVDRDGSVVVGSAGIGDGAEAFRWTGAGGMTNLGYLHGVRDSEALDVSDDGDVVVGVADNEAFRWTAAGGMRGLGELPGGTRQSEAKAVSADGSAVYGHSASAIGAEAFRWTAGGGMQSLNTLIDAPGYTLTDVLDVSGNGRLVVSLRTSAGIETSGILVPVATPTPPPTPAPPLTPTPPPAPSFATLTAGVLAIAGTAGDDRIAVAVSGGDLVVTRGTESKTFALADVTRLTFDVGVGNDRVDAGSIAKPTYMSGGSGDDTLIGGSGNDTLTGGGGRNRLYAGDGNDRLNGSAGRDFLYGEAGDDRMYGNAGNDHLDGGGGRDRAWAGDGDDVVIGGSSIDRLYGEAGRDTFVGGPGNDYLFGGDDDDTDGAPDAGDVVDSVESVRLA